MDKYVLRIAKPSDAKRIAALHYEIRSNYDVGFFSKMDKSFLTCYYRIVLNEPHEIIVCAEDKNGNIVGFNSCTLDAQKQKECLRRHRLRLAIASVPSIVRRPSMFKELLLRYKSTNNGSSVKYLATEGVRGEYWAWSPSHKDPSGSIEMNAAYRGILRALGVKEVFFEVDDVNKKVLAYHKLNKDIVLDTIVLPDGRTRYIMKSDLTINTKL